MSIDIRFRLQRPAFALDIQAQLPGQGITALFGRSGSGKTTVLRLLAGLDRVADGRARIGSNVWQDAATFVPAHRRAVGYVIQEGHLFPHLTVAANLDYGRRRAAASGGTPLAAARVIELLGLQPFVQRRPDSLSGGERQRVAIGRALLSHPVVLLMDEPLAGLDRESKAAILPYIEQIHRELAIPIIYVSHDTDEVARIAHHLAWIDAGRIAAHGPLTDMLTHPELPLARAEDAETVLETQVVGHDATYHLTRVRFAGGEISLPGRAALAVGAPVRIRIPARDVSLALTPAQDSSILNILPATVTRITALNPAQALVHLELQGTPLLARVTHKSVSKLALEVGLPVHAQIKSVALLA